MICVFTKVMAQDNTVYTFNKTTPHFQLLPMSKIDQSLTVTKKVPYYLTFVGTAKAFCAAVDSPAHGIARNCIQDARCRLLDVSPIPDIHIYIYIYI